MEKQGYEFFEHTADVGMRVSAPTLQELFDRAAHGLMVLLVNESRVATTDQRPITLAAASVDTLLLAWLKELLFWFATDRFVTANSRLEVTPTALRGVVWGEPFDSAHHEQGTEVKGVTYHQLRVAQTSQGWEAEVIFDV